MNAVRLRRAVSGLQTAYARSSGFLTAPAKPGSVDGRWLIVLFTVLYLTFVGYAISTRGWVKAWRAVKLPIPMRTFLDGRAVLQAVDNYRAGEPIPQIQRGVDITDPQLKAGRPDDPRHLPMAYPRLWLYLLAPTGLGAKDTEAVAITLATLSFLATIVFTGRLSVGEGCLYSIVLLSPSVMISVERANVDLLLYVMLIAACALLARGGALVWLAEAVILLAAMLKIYPVAAFASGLKRRNGLIAGAVGLIGFGVYAVVMSRDLRYIARLVPRGIENTFGVRVVFEQLQARLMPEHHRVMMVAAYLTLLVVVATAWFTARRRGVWIPLAQDLNGSLFLCGAFVFFMNFFLGNSWCYRTRFFLLLLPQLLAWRHRGGSLARHAMVLLLLIMITPYLLARAGGADRFGDLLCWGMLWYLAYFVTGAFKGEIDALMLRRHGLMRFRSGAVGVR